MRLSSLTELQLDALREVGSIGAGHAATALSQLVDRPVGLQLPTIEVIDISAVPYVFSGPAQVVCAVYARLLGDIGGGILFFSTEEAALSLVDLLRGREIGVTRQLGIDEEAMLSNAISILISAYLAAIARMADIDVLPSSPVMVFDMAGAILETAIVEIDVRTDQAVLVRTAFLDEDQSVDAALFFLPDPDSLSIILGRLGMA
jgi:chemotaxis protein CheC